MLASIMLCDFLGTTKKFRFKDGASDAIFYLTDHLESVVATVNESGALRNSYQYRPWGKRHWATIVDNNDFQYTAKER
ncbi:MAG: hypothetical protein AB1744_07880 [Candidatus Zixiibacteriota bacterium]